MVCNTNGDIYVAGTYRRSYTDSLATLQVSKFNKYGALLWQTIIGKASIADTYAASGGNAIDIDASGNIYVSIYQSDYFALNVIKLNSNGQIQWQKRETTSYFFSSGYLSRGISVDTNGDILLTGKGNTEIPLYKMNSSGALQWAKAIFISNASQWEGKSVDTDSSGNVYVVGTVDVSSTSYGYIAKYNSSGTAQWHRRIGSGSGGAEPDSLKKVVVDSSGNSYAIGYFGGVGGMVVMKYDTNGTRLWVRKFGGVTEVATGLTIDSSGNVYVLGYGQETLYYGLVAKYDTNGTLIWGRRFKGNENIGQPLPFSIQIDESSENIIIASYLYYSQYSGFYILKVPTSGDKTGTYTINDLNSSILYSSSTKTSSTPSLTTTTATYTTVGNTPLTTEDVTSSVYTSNTTAKKVDF